MSAQGENFVITDDWTNDELSHRDLGFLRMGLTFFTEQESHGDPDGITEGQANSIIKDADGWSDVANGVRRWSDW